ncbi:isoprenylcysteine carboxylmethyltransferase family protein [Winogradskyella sp.]|uniref:methyltransferase family protein n=1 Tax=Winogradskyella sp. TaxID=1883156 RepID=UPI00261291B0|nr:isoprenylcysteine carboxylmethyltransferase family protein [Winogradskyella sp.]
MALQEELKVQGDFLFKNRSYLPLIALGIGLLVFIHKEYNEIEEPNTWLAESFEFLSLCVSLVGLTIRIITVGHTPKNTSGRNTKDGQIADELNTTGMYSIVRHPLYLGNFFMWLGVAMLTENFWFIIAFVLFYVSYYVRIMYAEESFLRAKFGRLYSDWAETVPTIIPTFKYYKNPKYPFSIKKVLKKEKNGFCAIFLLFWMFDVVCRLCQKEPFESEAKFWFYAAIAATIIYFILKIMKKQNMLNEAN